MIVNWTKGCIKIIPAHIPTPTQPNASVRHCILPPGYSEVPNEVWKEARTFVAEELEKGLIVEEWNKVPRYKFDEKNPPPFLYIDAEDGREASAMRVPATLREVNRPKVLEIVKKCFHKATLEKWSIEENRPDVQKALVEQVIAVEKGDIAG